MRSVTTRGWTDSNRNYVVDCNLLDPGLQDRSATGGDLCAAATGNAVNFGKLGAATIVNPDILHGWGVRPNDYQSTFTVQHEIIPRLSAELSYAHRRFHGFFVTDDLNRPIAGSYETYTLTAPSDSRLPNGGGYPIAVMVPTVERVVLTALLFSIAIAGGMPSMLSTCGLSMRSKNCRA